MPDGTLFQIGTVTSARGGCQHDCPDTCAWTVEVSDGKATGLIADRSHPFTRGALCPKVSRYLADRVYGSERILTPLRRTGRKGSGQFESVTWDIALGEIAARLGDVVAKYGSHAVLPFSHQGSMGILQERSLDRRFFNALGSRRLLRDFCGYSAAEGISATIGPGVAVLPEQIVRSRLIVLWGTDTVVTNVHLWRLIEEARGQGAMVVTIDPLKSETARRSDMHLRPTPGSDTALCLAIAHVLFRDNLVDRDFLVARTLGSTEYEKHVLSFELDELSAATGVPVGDIEEFAHLYASRPPAVIRLMLGLEKHANGGMMARSVACLPALVGAWGQVGGGILALTNMLFDEALDLRALMRPELEDLAAPAMHWAELGQTLSQGGDDAPVRALVVYNSNPATTAPNQPLVRSGLAREDLLTIVHEQRLTDTAAYADYVLPATTMIEHWDLLRSWGSTYVTLNRPAIEPQGSAVSVPELFRLLARALGMEQGFLFDDDEALIRQALQGDSPLLEGITYERLLEDGWARLKLDDEVASYALAPFGTPSGRCELYSAAWAAEGRPPLPTHVPRVLDDYPLIFISTKSERKLFNSTYADDVHGRGQLKGPTIHMNSHDADERDLVDGQEVEVFNDRGAITVTLAVSDYVPAGVVSMPHGRWNRAMGVSTSPNVLTRDGISDMAGGSDYQDTTVDVRPAGGRDQRSGSADTDRRHLGGPAS